MQATVWKNLKIIAQRRHQIKKRRNKLLCNTIAQNSRKCKLTCSDRKQITGCHMGEQEAGNVGRGERDDKGAEGVFSEWCIMFSNFSVMMEHRLYLTCGHMSYVKLIKLNPLNMCSLLYISKNSLYINKCTKLESIGFQAGIKIAGRNINNFWYADDTTLMAEGRQELKNLFMKVKEESEKVGLKLNI